MDDDSAPLKHCPKCDQWKPPTPNFFAKNRNRRDGLQVYCKICLRSASDPLYYVEVPEGQKRCALCKQALPATLAYFSGHRRHRDGLNSRCKRCTGKEAEFGIIKETRPNEKQCPRCKQWYPKSTDHFSPDKAGKDGLGSHCRKCQSERKKARYAAMSDEEKAKRRSKLQIYYKTNREAICRQIRGHYHLTRDRQIQYSRDYRKLRYGELHSPEKRIRNRLYVREWRMRPGILDRRRGKDRVYSHSRRSRKRGIQGKHTHTQIQEQLRRQHYRCYYGACGHAKFEKRNGKHVYHIEHTFPLSRVAGTDIPANDMSYLVLACPSCNLSKHDKFPWEWPEGGRLL